ncbi:hypothetical protein HYH03_016999 [Edaphochlamys debaryana]|uniref:Uncharacterized protein n=1 Tax=Edaphochlamys debaryana TaxID=47281 RepID=A0A835XGH3_9CHLO|nr:hypothetical protein HYH03_016999 [Edaphochlamys debaryana]|eukprot:KAG2484187.1 hypothetical protein HYH03_016999 [Edaphochlamys debaryana]
MVEDSPAGPRGVAARKHSPWTADRTRKRQNKSRGLASPECHEALSEEVEEENSAEEPDAEMNEHEAEVLSGLGQLGLQSGVEAVARSDSAPTEGQRRKLRGTRSSQLSTGFHSRMSTYCPVNDNGSPLAPSAKSFNCSRLGGQENAAPILFAAGESASDKCWFNGRGSPEAPASTTGAPYGHPRAAPSTGAGAPLQPRQLPQASADQSLVAAAAVAAQAARHKQATATSTCESPAPKGRSLRRSLSGTGSAEPHAACSHMQHNHHLCDSAETLRGHAPAANAAATSSTAIPSAGNGLAAAAQPAPAPSASMSAYGIAAFGVPACVHSCFEGGASAMPGSETAVGCQAEGQPSLSLGASTASPSGSGRPNAAAPLPSLAAFAAGTGPVAAVAASGLAAGVQGLSRHSSHALASVVLGGNGLADSAEELELRRLARQPPPPSALSGLPPLLASLQQSSVPSAAASSSAGAVNASAAWAPFFGTIASAAVPAPVLPAASQPFDLAALARSAGSILSTGASAPHLAPAPPSGGDPSIEPTPAFRPGSTTSQPSHDVPPPRRSSLLQHCTLPRRTPGRPRAQDGPDGACMDQDLGPQGPNDTHGDADVDADVDGEGMDGDGDGDGTPWLRTSQQAPDLDDPSSAAKYSANLLRRLQAAAEHEELYGAASGDRQGHHSNYYHLQGAGGSGPIGYGYAIRNSAGPLSTGSLHSSMEPSPMPRLSSRLRRLRTSPFAPGGVGASGGSSRGQPSPSPRSTPSQLGTRSRSVGITPGGRRLRRRSHLGPTDQPGSSYYSRGGLGDEDLDEEGLDLDGTGAGDVGCSPDQSMDASAGFTRPRAQSRDQARHRTGAGLLASSCDIAVRTGSAPWLGSRDGAAAAGAAAGLDGPGRPLSMPSQRLSHPSPEFLDGLMDYSDEGVEYSTPPHTPLRGIGSAPDAEPVTRPMAAGATGMAPTARGAGAGANPPAAPKPLVAGRRGFGAAPGGLGGLLNGQRVSFANSEHSQLDTPLVPGRSPRRHSDLGLPGAADSLESAADFNRLLNQAASDDDRGRAERLWQEMCSHGVAPDVHTLNALLRCLSRSVADPDDAQALVMECCARGGFSPNGASKRLLEEICFRFEQLHGSSA